MMQTRTLLLILISVAFSVTGQLLLKTGAENLSGLGRTGFLIAAARNLYIIAGLAAWTASTICWLYVLRVAPLSRAYGLTSLTYVLILAASVLFLGEHVRRLHVVGTLLIVIGIVLLASGE